MKVDVTEYSKCVQFSIKAETVQEASLLLRFALNYKREVPVIKTSVRDGVRTILAVELLQDKDVFVDRWTESKE